VTSDAALAVGIGPQVRSRCGDREQAYLGAVEARRLGDKQSRDRAYADAMAAIAAVPEG
jgi:hypothetical protein